MPRTGPGCSCSPPHARHVSACGEIICSRRGRPLPAGSIERDREREVGPSGADYAEEER